jgi:hypothetical protein
MMAACETYWVRPGLPEVASLYMCRYQGAQYATVCGWKFCTSDCKLHTMTPSRQSLPAHLAFSDRMSGCGVETPGPLAACMHGRTRHVCWGVPAAVVVAAAKAPCRRVRRSHVTRTRLEPSKGGLPQLWISEPACDVLLMQPWCQCASGTSA